MSKLICKAISHTGLVRRVNEDNLCIDTVWNDVAGNEPYERLARMKSGSLCAVFDGMGGEAFGRAASALAAQTTAAFLKDNLAERGVDWFETMVFTACQRISEYAKKESVSVMGTTGVYALFGDDELHIVSLGDSRGYLMRDGELFQLTVDDNEYAQMVEMGVIDEKDTGVRYKFPLTRYIGSGLSSVIDIERKSYDYRRRDRILLCTDGLTDCVSDEDIAAILADSPFELAAGRLVEAALAGGGRDNITVITVYVK